MTEKTAYLLYDDKEQTILHTIAYSKAELKEETQYYSGGTWYEYDHIDNKFFVNEKILKGVKFPKEPIPHPDKRESTAEKIKWTRMGDLR